jgi:aconitate hydratase
MPSLDSLKSLKTLDVNNKTYHYFSLPDAAKSLGDLDKLPMSLKTCCAGKTTRPSPAKT